MKNQQLIKTNLLVSVVLILGFALTSIFSYHANYQSSLTSMEQISDLALDGIYYQLNSVFRRPVNISQTMAHDSLLVEHLINEPENLESQTYIQTLQTYLNTYREEYGFDAVFLVSSATGRYYNFNGLDRVLLAGNPENDWYFTLMETGQDLSMNVDNDEVAGSENAITVFVNCKIHDSSGNVVGVVGVGVRVDFIREFLRSYEEKYHVGAYLLNEEGTIELSTTYTGYGSTNWFQIFGQEKIRQQVLNWKKDTETLEIWTSPADGQGQDYVVTRYIPDLSWHLVVEQNTGEAIQEINTRLVQSIVAIAVIIFVVLRIITMMIRRFNQQITQLVEERESMFKMATEQLYDNIYELNITKNCTANQRTEKYFEELGAKDLPYDQGLRVIAEKQIKEAFREGYVSTFLPEHVMQVYQEGGSHLRYDFMITQDGASYRWMRIDAYIFLSDEDNCIHMFTYRKYIDEEKKKELLAYVDEMTGFLTKTATERRITTLLAEQPDQPFGFFLFDIDNFKQVNDRFGHAFGDTCIKEFTSILRAHFREGDVLGRIGGDEFVAFVPIPEASWVKEKAEEVTNALHVDCTREEKTWGMSASIGVSVAPKDGADFAALYKQADTALYRTKQRGKRGYTIS